MNIIDKNPWWPFSFLLNESLISALELLPWSDRGRRVCYGECEGSARVRARTCRIMVPLAHRRARRRRECGPRIQRRGEDTRTPTHTTTRNPLCCCVEIHPSCRLNHTPVTPPLVFPQRHHHPAACFSLATHTLTFIDDTSPVGIHHALTVLTLHVYVNRFHTLLWSLRHSPSLAAVIRQWEKWRSSLPPEGECCTCHPPQMC